MRTVKVFLSVRHVAKRGADPSDPKSFRFAAEWVSRGAVGCAVYVSKPCDTSEQAIALARKWLAERNKPVSLMAGGHVLNDNRTTYVDTTSQERP